MDNKEIWTKEGLVNDKLLLECFKDFSIMNFAILGDLTMPSEFIDLFFTYFNKTHPSNRNLSNENISYDQRRTLVINLRHKCALKRLSTKVIKLRNLRNLSISELARRAGMSPAFVCKLESGKSTIPKYDGILALAKALEVESNELLPLVGYDLQKAEPKTDVPWDKALEGILYDLGIVDKDKNDVMEFIEYKRWTLQQKK